MSKLIGYQIISDDYKKEIPECFYSFEVIEDVGVAEQWLMLEKKNPQYGEFRWVLLPIFEGDVENPTFLNYI